MTETTEAKFDQVSVYREALRKAPKSAVFVKETYDDLRVSGLDQKGATHPTAWPIQK